MMQFDTNVYYFSMMMDYVDYDLHIGSAYMQILSDERANAHFPIVLLG